MSTAEETREGFYISKEDEWIPDGWGSASLQSLTRTKNISYGVVQPGRQVSNGVPMIRVNDLTRGGDLVADDLLEICSEIASKHEKTTLEEGDLLLSLVGTTGLTFITRKEHVGWNVARAIAVIKPDSEIGAEWLKYYFETSIASVYLNGRANTTVQKTINLSDVKKMPVFLPPKKERKSITALLKSLDKKVELLREQNETLEILAQTLFKRWFIDFNFPDEKGNPYKDYGGKMVASELGEIPEGWSIDGINSFIKRHSISYRCTQADLEDNGKTQIFDQGSSGVYGFTNKEPDFDASLEDPVILFTNHTCNYWLVSFPFCAIQNVIPYRGKAKYPIYWLYFTTKNKIQFIEYKGHWPDLEAAKFIIPTEELRSAFDALAKSLCQKIFKNAEELKILTEFRDTLLPKLMKGEIRIPVES